MKMAIHLRRRPESGPARALLVPTRDAAEVLGLCARLGLDPGSCAHDVGDGYLLFLDEPTSRALPGVVRLRRLAANLLLPVDADLVPALLDDEAEGLTRDRGLVVLPGGLVLGFDPHDPVDPSTLLVGVGRPRRDWRPLPTPPALADRIAEIGLDPENETPDSVLDPRALLGRRPTPGGRSGRDPESTDPDTLHEAESGDAAGEIGTPAPHPEAAGPAATRLGGAARVAGRWLARLSDLLGLGGLARLGSRRMGRALDLIPRLSEAMMGRQEAALRALLREFREGDPERALRRALPMGEPGDTRGAGAYNSDHLPSRRASFSLRDLLGRESASLWLGGGNVWCELVREYRKAAMAAVRAGDHRRAAYIYGELLRDYRSAALALNRGGMHREAALLLLARLDDRRGAALAFEAAGESDRAVGLYRELGDHVAAGDLLRKIGEEASALAEYRHAADLLAATDPSGHLAAGELLLTKVGSRDPARTHFAAGWALRPHANAVSCALRLLRLDVEAGDLASLRRLLDEADPFLADQRDLAMTGRFYNELATLADRGTGDVAASREELRDRALTGIATELRERAAPGAPPAPLVAVLTRHPDAWPAAVLGDAEFALNAATRPPPLPPSTVPPPSRCSNVPPVRTLSVGRGVVTAFCAAPGSGEVFLGFEGGEIYVARPARGEVALVADEDLPVTALSTRHDGGMLLTLHSGTDPEVPAVLRAYERQPGGMYRHTHHEPFGETQPIDDGPPTGLTPIVSLPGGDRVGLAFGRHLALVAVASMTRERTFAFRDEESMAPVLLLPWPDDRAGGFAAFAHDGRQWTLFDPDGDVIQRTRLNWRPSLPESHPLRSVPVDWKFGVPDLLEVVGLGGHGTLHWAAFHRGDGRLDLLANGVATEDEGGYLAATVVRPRLVAGVTRTRIDWLRAGTSRFTLRSSTPVSLPAAVACVDSPRTGELFVICGDGTIARGPIPS